MPTGLRKDTPSGYRTACWSGDLGHLGVNIIRSELGRAARFQITHTSLQAALASERFIWVNSLTSS